MHGGDRHATSPVRGVALGALAGVVVAAIWFGFAVITSSRQPYLMVVIGVAVAYGVHTGMRRAGRAAALVAGLITLPLLLLTGYWVERYLVVKWFSDHDDHLGVPIVPYLDWMGSVYRHAIHESASVVVFLVVAVAAAVFFGFRGFDHHVGSGAAAGTADRADRRRA